MSTAPERPDADDTRALFDDNARTYDRVNSVISLGLDSRWRDWIARQAVAPAKAQGRAARVLDAFAGTGLVGLRAARMGARVTLADFSAGMLAVADERAHDRGLRITCVMADLAGDPARWGGDLAGPFDAITMVFGARYLNDPPAVIATLATRLDDDGVFVVMDFADGQTGLLSRLAAFYFFRVLPRIASALAGRRELYDRLVLTTHAMHGRAGLEQIVRNAGLSITETHVMGFGLVVGIVARRA